MRKIINLNADWRFIKQNIANAYMVNLDDANWESINIPHTWNAIDGITGGNDYFRGSCWYRKQIHIPTDYKGKRFFIEFGAASTVANVYLNGTHLGNHQGGYSIFRFDITDLVNFDKDNILAVQVDNSALPDIYPLWADFTFYGGIYRDVHLVVTDHVHFNLMDAGAQGVYVFQDNVTDDIAELSILASVINDSTTNETLRIWADILDANGNVIKYTAKELTLSSKQSSTVTLPITVENPILWNSKENPYMYTVHINIVRRNDVIDELIIPIGLRYFSFDPQKGFFLNGKYLQLNGVSRHQDKREKGWALTPEDHYIDMELIKDVGANSIRLAHYQHDQLFYNLCDEEGMIVWAEIPFISHASKTDLEGLNAKSQMVELIRQNFNHPSIIMWGVQNEIQIGGDHDYVRQIVKELHQLAKKEDPTRLTTQAQVMMVSNDDEYHTYTDIIAYNKYYGWYNGKAEDFGPWLDNFHKTNPNICLGVSEYGAEGILTYHTDEPILKDYTEEYHALYHEIVMDIFNQRAFIWGTYVWNFFDFGSDFRDEGGVKGRNNKGLVTFDRKIKKDAFYLYKSLWSDEAFVHITSKRFVERSSQAINIKTYSNCDEVTLYVNDSEFGTMNQSHIFNFENVPLDQGMNDIKALATKDGQTHTDYALFIKVDTPNPTYICSEEKVGIITNWFEDERNKHDYTNVTIKEITITDDVYSTKYKIKELMDNESTSTIIKEHFAPILDSPIFGMMEHMSIDQLAELASDVFTDKVLYVLNTELTQIKK